ncbi:hypothetical protein [Enterobacter roggenkampii]|uniref:hypothetical protein n=1 Tax=Enterobacter roggenkampii TaxID=1812935 RepID=UPI0027BB552C|nr:hypothetical protein [Enterobacter roggenkampii]MDQ2222091.1 hypothetical protein [Enterobacter roggenkampii]
MSTITREQLRERAREKVKRLEFAVTQTAFADSRAELEEELELARIALASLEAEPVAYMYKDNLHADARFSLHTRFGNWSQEDINEYEITEIPLYTAPPAPVSVPDLSALDNLAGEMLNHAMNCERRVAVAYTHCAHRLAEEVRDLRAAMLQGAAGNSPVLPDGWVMVPVEPTAEMQSAAAGAIRFDTTPINKLWTGNAVYRAMLAAAPQQEV